MKGVTAINLFVQDMPRLSVDIDVVCMDYTASRDDATSNISRALQLTREELEKKGMRVSRAIEGREETELYGSKLVAALDRQHPRDFFDVLGMYDQSGLTPQVLECFVCYLAGPNRPVHEVLFSRDLEITSVFENEFVGMTTDPIDLRDLVVVRDRLRADLRDKLTKAHRDFLLGLVQGEPDWTLMSCPYLSELPAIRWKLMNLAKLKKSNPAKFAQQSRELRDRF